MCPVVSHQKILTCRHPIFRPFPIRLIKVGFIQPFAVDVNGTILFTDNLVMRQSDDPFHQPILKLIGIKNENVASFDFLGVMDAKRDSPIL